MTIQRLELASQVEAARFQQTGQSCFAAIAHDTDKKLHIKLISQKIKIDQYGKKYCN